MSLDVRLARPEEYDAVGALTAAAYVDDGLAGGGYAQVLRDAAGRAAVAELLVAVEDEEVLGTVTLVSPDAPEEWRETERADAGTIRMLATAKPARGRGAGTALTVAGIRRARSHGRRGLRVATQANTTDR